jgi:hypothetical protein
MHHHHSCCCGDPAEPCTRTGCPNGFSPVGGGPEPILGCTFNELGVPNTRLQAIASMQYNGVFDFPPNPFEHQPTVSQGFVGSGSTPNNQAQCCRGSFERTDYLVTGLNVAPDGTTDPNRVNGVAFKFGGTVNLETGNISATLEALPRVWFLSDGPEFNFSYGGVGFRTTLNYDPNDPSEVFDYTFLAEGDGYTHTVSATPILRTGLGGRITPIGLTMNVNSQYVNPGSGNPNSSFLTRSASYTGQLELRLLNLAVFDPACPEPILDPGVQGLLEKQSRGGGCQGCGDGNTF